MRLPNFVLSVARIFTSVVVVAVTQPANSADLRLMTYNVHHCEGVDGKLVSTHLDHSSGENDREQQTATLRKLFGNGPRQAILAGDFNATVARPEMTIVLKKWTDVDAAKLTPTIPVSKPTLKIDYIFVQHDSPWKVISSQVLNEPVASDHLPLVATLRK